MADTGTLQRDNRTVLVVHNAYQQRGGEDAVVEAEIALLRNGGYQVVEYRRSNDDLQVMGRVSAAIQTVWSNRTCRDLTVLIRQHRPMVLHVHNTFPLISPSVYWVASRHRVPVVQTLHNFRLICPQALLLREGRVCEDCVGHVPWRAVQHACYRNSTAQSAVTASMLQLHRTMGTWQDKVTRYIALNDFCRDRFIAGGLPPDRIRVKPNFIDLPRPMPTERRDVLFVGRLSHEKGMSVLRDLAPRLPSHSRLRVVGSGPDAWQLAQSDQIDLLGTMRPEQIYEEMARATALVLPSIWYENFPRTLVEAFANGLPVVGSRLGAMPSLIEEGVTGLLFEPGNAGDLADKLSWLDQNPDAARRMGQAARAYYEQHLTAEQNMRLLQAIYEEAVDEASVQG